MKTKLCSLKYTPKQLIVLLPVAYFLSLTGNVNYVWWSYPIAEMMSLSMTIYKKLRLIIRSDGTPMASMVSIYHGVIKHVGEEKRADS